MKDVLLIEDARYRKDFSSALRGKGLLIKEAESAKDAVLALETERFSTIVADINMVSGAAAFWNARARFGVRVPVILTCDRAAVEDALFPIQEEVHEIILKPYAMAETIALIMQAKKTYRENEQIAALMEHAEARVRFALPSHAQIVGAVSAYFRKYARLHGYENEALDLSIAVEEALMNAIRHGNNGDRGKKVNVQFSVTPQCCIAEIEDEGNGFDFENEERKAASDAFANTGRGIFLIARHADEYRYEKDGARVRLIKNRL